GEDELTRQLRGDLVRALGALGDDRAVQARAAELYAGPAADLDPNVLPAIIGVLAHAGDAARFDEFSRKFRSATTPQEEQRYLYALAAFRQRELLAQTLARAINGEFRTQDAPFVVRSLLTSVHARELAWEFVKANWDTMERQYPKAGLRRLAGLVGPAGSRRRARRWPSGRAGMCRRVRQRRRRGPRLRHGVRRRPERLSRTDARPRAAGSAHAHRGSRGEGAGADARDVQR